MAGKNNIILAIEQPQLEAAKKRAEELAKTFNSNEVIKMLENLKKEVSEMKISGRFSRIKRIFSVYPSSPGINRFRKDVLRMTEAEHKRWRLGQLIQDLQGKILNLVDDFHFIILEIEAAKLD